MELLKKIAVAALVLLISTAVFFMLIKEQDMKKDILRSTLELFGKELLAMVPDSSPQKKAIAEAINVFIDQAEQNNVPEEKIQKTIALGLNISMNPKQLSPEELQAVFDIQADSADLREMRENSKRHPRMDKERLAHEINVMIDFRRELADMERNSGTDSLSAKFANRVAFTADSGLKILIPKEFPFHGDRPMPSEWRNRLDKLERDKMVISYDFRHLPPDIQKLQLADVPQPPPIPPEVYAEIIMQLKRTHVNPDSLNLPAFLSNPDSLNAFLARIQKSTGIRFQLN
jgi:hypothetical protein